MQYARLLFYKVNFFCKPILPNQAKKVDAQTVCSMQTIRSSATLKLDNLKISSSLRQNMSFHSKWIVLFEKVLIKVNEHGILINKPASLSCINMNCGTPVSVFDSYQTVIDLESRHLPKTR